MPKIKEIRERLLKNPSEYTSIRFLVAERVFITVATFYFLSFLFTVGGYYFPGFDLETLSMLTFHLHSFLIIVMVWFGFSAAEYFVAIYYPHHNWIPYFIFCILFLIGSVDLFVHLSPLF